MLDLGNILTTVMYGIFGNLEPDTAIQIISESILPGGISNLSNSVAKLSTSASIVLSSLTVVLLTGLLLLAFVTLAFG